MTDLVGQEGELVMTIQVTRKDTGKVEEYQLVGRATAEQAAELGLTTSQEQTNGSNP